MLIREAFHQGRGGIPMTLIAIAAVGWMQWHEQNANLHLPWLLAAFAVALLRGAIIFQVLRFPERWTLTQREWLFNGPLMLTALLWAALPLLTFDTATDNEKFVVVCIMSGLAGGAASVLAPLQWPARFYLFCVLIPGAFLIREASFGPVISFLGGCFFIVMLLGHASARKLLIDAHLKRIHNDELLGDVQAQREQVEQLNRELRTAEAALRQQNADLEQEIALRTERNRLAYAVIQNTAEAVMVTTQEGRIVEVNPAFTRITGYSASEALKASLCLLRSDMQTGEHYMELMQQLITTGKWEGEMWSQRQDGSLFLERRSMDAVRDETGTITHFVSVFNDITEDYHKDEQLRHMACHDPLTGLANRSLLHEHLRLAIARASRDQSRVGVLFMDLDQFKAVNDTLGHDVGDLLLKAVADRLQSCLRASDTLARLGGDEFVVLLNPIAQREDCALIADKLMHALQAPVDLSGSRLYVNTSIGIATYPDDGKRIDTLMKNADMALYAAKAAGKNRYDYFHESLSEDVAKRREMEVALRKALDIGELSLHFQPKIDTVTLKASGFEALVRWERPGIGFVRPDLFIPVAEESGLIDALGKTVIAQACRQIADWHAAGFGWQNVAVNVSARQLVHQDLPGLLATYIEQYDLPRGSLEIEVTESVVMAKPEITLPRLGKIRDMGIRIAIDDFGTGHSSLAYLRHLPIDIMKIDRAFVHEAAVNPTSQAIIQTIVSLSRALGLQVVAEGVETEAQVQMLRDTGCDQLQGYYFSRPMAATEIAARWLSAIH